MIQKIIPCVYLKNDCLVTGFDNNKIISDNPVDFCTTLNAKGADAIIIFDLSDDDASHEESLLTIRKISSNTECELIGAGNIKRLEDVKKLIYAGCKRVALNLSKDSNIALIEEAGKRFGKSSIFACADIEQQVLDNIDALREYSTCIILLNDCALNGLSGIMTIPVLGQKDAKEIIKGIDVNTVYGLTGEYINSFCNDLFELKNELEAAGLNVEKSFAKFEWSDFKLNSDGMIPCIVQDIKTNELLMMAYMNEEAYNLTAKTGIMTYYSRSRNELWKKGETSGHYQYLKELSADCDMDTLVAKVVQIGAACHTGAYSCFFNEILKKEFECVNPLMVFENVYDVIMDRKLHPKEGSYTNYLFDKGIDKILKKVGEEATEIVIAAKNPEKEEVKYEIADFLYHVMVLMAECDLTWEDITRELANR